MITDENDLVRVGYFLHTLRVFEVEMLVRLGEWEAVGRVVGVSLVLYFCWTCITFLG